MTRESLRALADRCGTDKGTLPGDFGHPHHYTDVYERFLEPLRDRPLRLLEIGVWKGASLRMWEQYLSNATVIGIENLPDVIEGQFERASVMIGDATDTGFLDQVVDEFTEKKIDVVIDDGSHVLEQQISCLEHLMPKLAEDGLYFVEDVACSRFPKWNQGTLPFRDFLDYAGSVAVQATFFDNDSIDEYHTIQYLRALSDEQKVPIASVWNRTLFGTYLFHNIVVFEKRVRKLPQSLMNSPPPIRPSKGFADLPRTASDRGSSRWPVIPRATSSSAPSLDLIARAHVIESENLRLAVERNAFLEDKRSLQMKLDQQEGELVTQQRRFRAKLAELEGELVTLREQSTRLTHDLAAAKAAWAQEQDARLKAESAHVDALQLIDSIYASPWWRIPQSIRNLKNLFIRRS